MRDAREGAGPGSNIKVSKPFRRTSWRCRRPRNRRTSLWLHLFYHDLHTRLDPGSGRDGGRLQSSRLRAVEARRGATSSSITPPPQGRARATPSRCIGLSLHRFARRSRRPGFVLDAENSMLANTDDTHSIKVFDPSIKGETDRFCLSVHKAVTVSGVGLHASLTRHQRKDCYAQVSRLSRQRCAIRQSDAYDSAARFPRHSGNIVPVDVTHIFPRQGDMPGNVKTTVTTDWGQFVGQTRDTTADDGSSFHENSDRTSRPTTHLDIRLSALPARR